MVVAEIFELKRIHKRLLGFLECRESRLCHREIVCFKTPLALSHTSSGDGARDSSGRLGSSGDARCGTW